MIGAELLTAVPHVFFIPEEVKIGDIERLCHKELIFSFGSL